MGPTDLRADARDPSRFRPSDRYRAVFEASPDAILIVDSLGRVVDANPEATRLFGYAEEELVGECVDLLLPEEAREPHASHRRRYFDRPRARMMGDGAPFEARRKDGSPVPVEIALSPVRTPEGAFAIAAVRDVTRRRQLEAFGAATLRAVEEERRRVARELHDGIGQGLATLLVLVEMLSGADEGEPQTRLQEMRTVIRGLTQEARRISRGLRPPALEEQGAVAAIASHGRELQLTTGLRVDVDAEAVDADLSPDRRLALFRIVQEALANVVRHARAERVGVRIRREGDRVLASVVDDGRGFWPHSLGTHGGLGLIGMQERAAAAGGRLEVESRPGRGATVRLELPTDRGRSRNLASGPRALDAPPASMDGRSHGKEAGKDA